MAAKLSAHSIGEAIDHLSWPERIFWLFVTVAGPSVMTLGPYEIEVSLQGKVFLGALVLLLVMAAFYLRIRIAERRPQAAEGNPGITYQTYIGTIFIQYGETYRRSTTAPAAQAFVRLRTNPVRLIDSFNVTSISDTESGSYTINFARDFRSDNYSVVPIGSTTHRYSVERNKRSVLIAFEDGEPQEIAFQFEELDSARSQPRQIEPDATIRWAAEHLREVLYLPDIIEMKTWDALRQAARLGKIQVWGRPDSNFISANFFNKPLEPISVEHWKDYNFDYMECVSVEDDQKSATKPDNMHVHPESGRYLDLHVDRAQILEVWPSKPPEQRLRNLRKIGVEIRNRAINADDFSEWKRGYESWRADVLATALQISPSLHARLETLNEMGLPPQGVVTISDEHRLFVTVMSEILRRIEHHDRGLP